MDIKDIKKIADETGMGSSMYDRPRLTDMGDGTSKFISIGQLTYYGENLVAFANAVEKQAASDNEQLLTLIKAIYVKLHYGDIFQWDDGDPCWELMNKTVEQAK